MSARTIAAKVCFALAVLVILFSLLGWAAISANVGLLALMLVALGFLLA